MTLSFQSRHATVSVDEMLEALQRTAADKVWENLHIIIYSVVCTWNFLFLKQGLIIIVHERNIHKLKTLSLVWNVIYW